MSYYTLTLFLNYRKIKRNWQNMKKQMSIPGENWKDSELLDNAYNT